MMSDERVFVGLDIGTTKIAAVVVSVPLHHMDCAAGWSLILKKPSNQ
jgi:cell division ATPase FtsA